MKGVNFNEKLSYLIVLVLILGLVLTGCLLSNIGQAPATEQSGITYFTKQVPFSADLVALWHFDEGSEATTVADSSGNDNTGDIYDATPGEVGQFGNALRFDGNDYVMVPGSTSLSGINSVITVETWIKFSNVTNAFYVRTPYDSEDSRAWGLDRLGGNLRFYIYNNNNYFICQKWWTPVVDQWYHIAGTYNGEILELYVDKELVKSFEHVGAIDSTDQGVVIGAKYSDGSEGNLHGLIDQVRIWNRALTDAEITYNYDNSLRNVGIDIKPGSDPNSINLGSNGVVPVAILGSADFDAATVNPSTVTLAGATVKLKGKVENVGSLEDVNDDGKLDLVVQVYTSELPALGLGDSVIFLTAYTYNGLAITGSGSVRIVKE